MSASAWGEEPSNAVRFWRNHVRAAIGPNHPTGQYVACGLFNERGADDGKDCLRWISHDVADMETALRIVNVALDRRLEVWTQPTADLLTVLPHLENLKTGAPS